MYIRWIVRELCWHRRRLANLVDELLIVFLVRSASSKSIIDELMLLTSELILMNSNHDLPLMNLAVVDDKSHPRISMMNSENYPNYLSDPVTDFAAVSASYHTYSYSYLRVVVDASQDFEEQLGSVFHVDRYHRRVARLYQL